MFFDVFVIRFYYVRFFFIKTLYLDVIAKKIDCFIFTIISKN